MAGDEKCHPELRFLPDSPLKMTLQQMNHVVARLRAISAEKTTLCDELEGLLDAIEPRVTNPAQTMGELASREEGDRWEEIMNRLEELEAAFDALHDYMAPVRAAAGAASVR